MGKEVQKCPHTAGAGKEITWALSPKTYWSDRGAGAPGGNTECHWGQTPWDPKEHERGHHGAVGGGDREG